jgi:hypothetical protein
MKNLELENEDEGPGIFPPVCSRCNTFHSWTELLEIDSEVQAKMIDNKFVCSSCLTKV